jgi:hypothetical protein
MPLLYGEGHKTLLRLGEEIERATRKNANTEWPLHTERSRSEFLRLEYHSRPQLTNSQHPPSWTPAGQPETSIGPSALIKMGTKTDHTRTQSSLHPNDANLRPSQTAMSHLLVRVMWQTASRVPQTLLRTGVAARSTYECLFPECARSRTTFTRKVDLERHYSVKHDRTALRLIDCEVSSCERRGDYGFTSRDKMIQHMRNHQRPRPPKPPLPRDGARNT